MATAVATKGNEFEQMGAVPTFQVTLFVRRFNPEDGQEAR